MVRDFARLQLFLRAPINFHSARSSFFFLSHDRDKLFNGEKRWRHFSAQQSRSADTVIWFSEHVLCSFFFPPPPSLPPSPLARYRRVFVGNACFLLPTPTDSIYDIPGALPSHVSPARAAILRIATSRKRILRPQLRVQAILLLNIPGAWEPAPGERVSTK